MSTLFFKCHLLLREFQTGIRLRDGNVLAAEKDYYPLNRFGESIQETFSTDNKGRCMNNFRMSAAVNDSGQLPRKSQHLAFLFGNRKTGKDHRMHETDSWLVRAVGMVISRDALEDNTTFHCWGFWWPPAFLFYLGTLQRGVRVTTQLEMSFKDHPKSMLHRHAIRAFPAAKAYFFL